MKSCLILGIPASAEILSRYWTNRFFQLSCLSQRSFTENDWYRPHPEQKEAAPVNFITWTHMNSLCPRFPKIKIKYFLGHKALTNSKAHTIHSNDIYFCCFCMYCGNQASKLNYQLLLKKYVCVLRSMFVLTSMALKRMRLVIVACN